MEKKPKLLVIEDKGLAKDPLGFRIARTKIIKSLIASGAKLIHDSGGKLIIIDVPEGAEKTLLKNVTGVRLVAIETDMKDEIPDLNTDELLFLSALKKRTSKKFRDFKKSRKPGDSPEEKELSSASCVRDEL